jgi:3-deoxy-D-manno-octulosonic-acid transferase
VLLTFFSPSGYEARKDHPLATHVDYLPADTRSNAERLIQLTKPRAAVFIKYEFWYQHLMGLHRAGIPTYLVSAIFRQQQPFFRWFGGGHRAMLRTFRTLFVQNGTSRSLLSDIGITNVVVSGDTRFDRVARIADLNAVVPLAEAFRKAASHPVLVAGSTWKPDDRHIREALAQLRVPLRCVMVPHELGGDQVEAIAADFPPPVIRWSTLEQELEADRPTLNGPNEPADQDPLNARTLLVDRMGWLSRSYKYADIAYVGGGFGTGIHNLLEAAAWGKPVVFGPNHARFAEAQGLVDAGGGFCVRNSDELRNVLERLLTDRTALDHASAAALRYVQERKGATARILEHLALPAATL